MYKIHHFSYFILTNMHYTQTVFNTYKEAVVFYLYYLIINKLSNFILHYLGLIESLGPLPF
jgi:hypothetical protein